MSDDQIKMIDADTLAAWLASGEAALYDVREIAEFEQARIPGSTLLPLSAFDPSEVVTNDGRKLVFHCKSGVRCGMASERMIESGHTGRINRLTGGIIAWANSGHPIEPGTDD